MSSPPQSSEPAGPAAGTLPDTGIGKREDKLFSFPGNTADPDAAGGSGSDHMHLRGRDAVGTAGKQQWGEKKRKPQTAVRTGQLQDTKKSKTQLLSHHPRLKSLGEERKRLL